MMLPPRAAPTPDGRYVIDSSLPPASVLLVEDTPPEPEEAEDESA
jgi:hypothetical protein